MKNFLKTSGWILLGLSGIAAIAVVVIMVINRSDRSPSVAANRLEQLAGQVVPVADQDNGFVYVMGFGAGAGQDPAVLGAKRIAWTREMISKKDAEIGAGSPLDAPRPTLDPGKAMKALGATCKSVDAACYAALESGAATIEAWLAGDDWLLKRYQELLARPAWLETAAFDSRLPIPRYAQVLDGQRLHLLQAWRAAVRGDALAVKRLLERDGVFWRTVLASADTLIPKMIARSALARNFEWGNLITRRLPPEAALSAVPEHWQREISAHERSMLRTSAGEYRYAAHTIRFFQNDPRALFESAAADADADAGEMLTALMMPTFQPQDYKNRYAGLVTEVSDMLDVPYPAYPAAVVRARSLVGATAAQAFDHPLYNWPGNALLEAALPDFISYAVVVADLEGVRRLALLATQLRAAKVAPAEVPRALAGAALRDPYDGRPLKWDAQLQALVFVGLQALPRGRHAMAY